MKYGNGLTKTEGRRVCLVLLHAAAIAGIAAGAFAAVRYGLPDAEHELWLHQCFSPEYSGNTVLAVFWNTLKYSLIYLVGAFLLGFFSLGQPLGVGMMLLRGVGIGASVAMMYMSSGTDLLGAAAVLVLPKAMILTFLTALAVRESLKLSTSQLRIIISGDTLEEKLPRTVKLYVIKFLVLAVIAVLVSAADSVMNYIFMDLY